MREFWGGSSGEGVLGQEFWAGVLEWESCGGSPGAGGLERESWGHWPTFHTLYIGFIPESFSFQIFDFPKF